MDLNPNNTCTKTIVHPLAEALCDVLAVRFLVASETGTSHSAQFDQFNNADLNLSACGGERFSIKATFQLPQFSAGCCSSPTTTFVTLSSDNKFEFAPSLIDDTIYDFFGDANPPHVMIYLRRKANSGGTTNSVRISVGGTYQNGQSYTGQGIVHPVCQ